MQEPCEITCPHCWQPNTVLLDTSVPGQTMIQDCEVCCNPYEISYTASDGDLESVEVRSLEQ